MIKDMEQVKKIDYFGKQILKFEFDHMGSLQLGVQVKTEPGSDTSEKPYLSKTESATLLYFQGLIILAGVLFRKYLNREENLIQRKT